MTSESPSPAPTKRKRLSPGMLLLRDAAIAMAFVASILLAMYAYTGLWPPLVVVESDSMMHSEDNTSYVGVIDTGDMVLVKDVDRASDIITYIEGFVNGHRTYGDFGDVIVYNKMGDDSITPIIHRAIVYLEANEDGSYRCEALQYAPDSKWSVSSSADSWDHLTSTLTIYHVGYRDTSVNIQIGSILDRFRTSPPTDGFITKGDHNSAIDQSYAGSYVPVDVDWVVGKARGEIPWFGLLKLWATDSLKSEAPENSVHNLWISIAIIVIVPIVIDVVLTFKVRRKISRKREEAREEYEREHAQELARNEEEEGSVPEPPTDEEDGQGDAQMSSEDIT